MVKELLRGPNLVSVMAKAVNPAPACRHWCSSAVFRRLETSKKYRSGGQAVVAAA
jgi:hypothetical protein